MFPTGTNLLQGDSMLTTITHNGQTLIPASIRERFNLSAADWLEWIVENDTIRVIPIHSDPIATFRGQGRSGAVQRLLAERQQNRKTE